MVKLMALFFLLSTPCAFAFDGNLELCQQMAQAKEELAGQKLPDIKTASWQIFLHKIFPSRSFKLTSSGPVTELGRGSKSTNGKRHLIVAFGVESSDEVALKRYEWLSQQIATMSRQLLDLFQQKSVEHCLRRAQRLEFSAEDFQHKRQELARYEEGKRHRELREVERNYARLSKGLRQQWELQTGLHVAELMELINRGEIDHLIIVAHANQAGHLVDSFGNYFPSGIFHGVSEKLKSLSIFSCHGQNVKMVLGMEQEAIRYYFPDSDSPLMNDVILLPALPAFVSQVSKELKKGRLARTPGKRGCSLSITGGSANQEVAFLLGDKYLIGHYDGKARTYPFDCKLLEQEEMLSVRSLNPKIQLSLTAEWKLSLKAGSQQLPVELLEHYFSEGRYEGSLYLIQP
jgi:hypothetical protein